MADRNEVSQSHLYGTTGIGMEIVLDIVIPDGLEPGDGVLIELPGGVVIHDGRRP